MQSTEKYLKVYRTKKEELSKKNELWRLRITEEEFLKEIDRLKQYEKNNKESKHLNDYHIERNIDTCIEVMLMNKPTTEEVIAQITSMTKASEEQFVSEATEIQNKLPFIKIPLRSRDARNIYVWIFRKQISIDMLPLKVKDDFIKTKHYETLKNMKKI